MRSAICSVPTVPPVSATHWNTQQIDSYRESTQHLSLDSGSWTSNNLSDNNNTTVSSPMASGPHNGTTTSFPPIPNFSQFKSEHMLPPQAVNTSSSSMPRLNSADSFFLRPPTTSTGSPAPAIISGLMPPLGLMNQFDPAMATAAAMAVAGGKISPSVTSSYSPGEFPNAAAAAAAAAVQAASMKMASGRTTQAGLPPMAYEKMMANMFFSRPDMSPGVAPPPPLGVRPTHGAMMPSETPLFPPPPGCTSSPFPGCASAKLPSPVLPHSANRVTPATSNKAEDQGERDDNDSCGEKNGKNEIAEQVNEESNPSAEYNGSNNGELTSPNAKAGAINNNYSSNKLISKGIEFSYDDKSQTESEVQKLMSIALSNNQKRLEKACLNAIDKGPATQMGSENASSNTSDLIENSRDFNISSSESQFNISEAKQENIEKKSDAEECDVPNKPPEADKREEPCGNLEESKASNEVAIQNGDINEIPITPADEMERPNDSGRASVESEESMTSSNVEMLVANAQPDKEGLFFCHLCEFTGSTRTEFQDHMNWHYDFRCPKCDYTSRTEGRLNRHIRDFHSEVPPQNFSGKVTRVNKPKTHKCKQCNYVALTKTDFWAHSRTHIKDDKILECPKCDFVTEYKHHLEYHIRNHFGSKPYKCEKCNYECVNKSMLNSHMKSHTNVYQYRCADCQYATKYCHSLKLHLGKYQHRPATILNSDGSLPEYDNSTDILSIKRGPPRGSRLQRINSEPNSLPQTTSPIDIAGANGPLSFLHAGAPMGNFWSLPIPHQPGLFPGLPTMPPAFMNQPGAIGSMCNPPASVIPPYLLPNSSMNLEDSPANRMYPKLDFSLNSSTEEKKDGSLELHCNFCDHQADSRDSLVRHMLQNHKDENTDLFGASLLSGFATDNMNVMKQSDAVMNGLENLVGSDALDLRSKKPKIDSENALQNFFKRSIAQAIGALPEEVDESSPAKRKCKDSPSPIPGLSAADTPTGRKRPRKSKAFRINDLSQHLQSETNDSNTSDKSGDFRVKNETSEDVPEDDDANQDRESRINESGDSSALALDAADHELDALVRTQECHHCNILFRDRTMFEMHMGYHGYGNPFKCNRCGNISQDKVQFFIHLCQMAHS